MKTEQLAALISLLHVPLVGAYKARNLVTTFHEIKYILLSLELKGAVLQLSGKQFVRA